MKRIRKVHRDSDRRAAEALAAGELVVLPTDTLYGFSVPLGSKTGRSGILRLKGEDERRFLYVASSVDMVEHHIASWGCSSSEEMGRHWPAPLSAIFEAAEVCPSWIGDTIALRVPDDEWLRRVIDRVGEPLLSTSVNVAGALPLHDADEIDRLFGPDVELVVVADRPLQERSSTVVDLTGRSPRVIRRGAYAWPAGENPSK
ncbi:MAG: L-threonylcarbamoyladenylate synthase [Candidatus Krumholzibacteria bacterium]